MSPFWKKRSDDFIVSFAFAVVMFFFNLLMTGNIFSSLFMAAFSFLALFILSPILGNLIVFFVNAFRNRR